MLSVASIYKGENHDVGIGDAILRISLDGLYGSYVGKGSSGR
jgi:hypothetical protein